MVFPEALIQDVPETNQTHLATACQCKQQKLDYQEDSGKLSYKEDSQRRKGAQKTLRPEHCLKKQKQVKMPGKGLH